MISLIEARKWQEIREEELVVRGGAAAMHGKSLKIVRREGEVIGQCYEQFVQSVLRGHICRAMGSLRYIKLDERRGWFIDTVWAAVVSARTLVLSKNVVAAIRWFFETGKIPKGGNSSFITLIPKIPNANMVKDYRPISLIGSVYKIIAKILANRLTTVLGDPVIEIQSAFVKDRQILDGPFILNEIMQWCKSKKKQTMVFKVDFKKAYDSIRWDFLDDVMKKFGFGEIWCNWIQSCLQTSRGSVLVNGSHTREFQFHKGLKQGDPLSPFLFILVMESLHISFQRWNQDNIDTLIHVLDIFHRASGLRINMSKKSGVNRSLELMLGRKSVLVSWKRVLNSKDRGGLGVSSMFALNRALLFKWVWRFINHKNSMWVRVIKALHGSHGRIGSITNTSYPSVWLSILQEVEVLKSKGIDLLSFVTPVLGNGMSTSFWDVAWCGDVALKTLAPRIYDLESRKDIVVASKLAHNDLEMSLRRRPRVQDGTGDFSVSSVRRHIDDHVLPSVKERDGLRRFPSRLIYMRGKELHSYDEWLDWMLSIRLSSKLKKVFEAFVEDLDATAYFLDCNEIKLFPMKIPNPLTDLLDVG
ncbi:RNA-directed DNA polymerase, eukaryota, reverse transcriptase zinc-binding domain protein [Tanacetum coccineum]